jgi:hypothetical protein
MFKSSRLLGVLVCALLASACDGSPTDGGGGASRVLAAGSVATGQLAAGDTSQSYSVRMPAGQFKLLFQARSGSALDTLVAEIRDEAGVLKGVVQSVGSDTSLTAQASEWIIPAPGARWSLRVHGRSANDQGAWSASLFERNALPEHVPATISLGQTVEGERIDVDGDVDQFLLQGQAGQTWVVFAQADPAHPTDQVRVQVVDSISGQAVAEVTAFGASEAIEMSTSGRVVLPRTGIYLVRVGGGRATGPYRVRVDGINPAPESGSGSVALGAVISEGIGTPADVDEYSFTAHAGQEMNLLVQLQSGMSEGLRVDLVYNAQTIAAVEARSPNATLDELGTGRIRLPGEGTYTVRVYGPAGGMPAAITGQYRLELYPVDRRVESGGTLTLDGPPLAGTLERPGDVDEFTFTASAGQLAVLHLEGSTHGGLLAELVDPAGVVQRSVITAGNSGDAGVLYSKRLGLPSSGTWTLRVSGGSPLSLSYGPFSAEVYTVNPAPEHVSGVLHLGQTITGERIDRPGDLDVFTIYENAQESMIFFGAARSDTNLSAVLRRAGAGAYEFFHTFAGTMELDNRSIGRIALSGSNWLLTVDPDFVGYGGDVQGAYGIRWAAVNRAPEGRSATYTLGDTVSNEPLYPSGDIDEYGFDLPATTTLDITWPVSFNGPSDAVFGILYNAAGQGVWNNFETDNGERVRTVTLPAGHYRLSVLNQNIGLYNDQSGARIATLPYTFAFVPR